MNRSSFSFVVLLLTATSCQQPKESSTERFQGTWRLDKFEVFDNSLGAWIADSARIGYSGFIMYDGQGHMCVQLLPENYKKVNTHVDLDTLESANLKELIDHYSSNYVYFANYVLTDSTVEHTILSATDQQQIGRSLKRKYYFNADTLILTPYVGTGERKLRLKWIKL